MIKLYYAAPSIYGRKVLAVLEEKGLDYSIEPMTFGSQDHKKAEYLKLNPNGEIPTLVDDDRVIYESTAINEYLDEEYPYPSLMPKDSYERAKVRMIEDYCDLHFYRTAIKCYIKKGIEKAEIGDDEKADVIEHLKRIEAYLGNQKFMVGEFSIADCAVMPAFAGLEALGVIQEAKLPPTLKAYYGRLKTRAGFKGANLLTLEEAKA